MPVENSDMQNSPTNGLVIVFPARTPVVENKQIFYLFSVRQVAEVLNCVNVHPVPHAAHYAEGVTQWRGRVLPVLSLEHFLGITVSGDQKHLRSIVVRSIAKDSDDMFHEVYTVFKVGAAIQQLELPMNCKPVSVPDWVTDATVLSGVYQWERRLLLVINMEAILLKENEHDYR
jgi:chemotaxis signal transduction protein